METMQRSGKAWRVRSRMVVSTLLFLRTSPLYHLDWSIMYESGLALVNHQYCLMLSKDSLPLLKSMRHIYSWGSCLVKEKLFWEGKEDTKTLLSFFHSLWCPVRKEGCLTTVTKDILWYINIAEEYISSGCWALTSDASTEFSFVNV